jgi:hypothetical protein
MTTSSHNNIDKSSNNGSNDLLSKTADDHQYNIGKLTSSDMRVESDSMGDIEVPADHYWGSSNTEITCPCHRIFRQFPMILAIFWVERFGQICLPSHRTRYKVDPLLRPAFSI